MQSDLPQILANSADGLDALGANVFGDDESEDINGEFDEDDPFADFGDVSALDTDAFEALARAFDEKAGGGSGAGKSAGGKPKRGGFSFEVVEEDDDDVVDSAAAAAAGEEGEGEGDGAAGPSGPLGQVQEQLLAEMTVEEILARPRRGQAGAAAGGRAAGAAASVAAGLRSGKAQAAAAEWGGEDEEGDVEGEAPRRRAAPGRGSATGRRRQPTAGQRR